MIVTSKRCFLNVLTQLCDRETLLNANYYMADMRSPNGNAMLGDIGVDYDDDGQLYKTNYNSHSYSTSCGKYNIRYGSDEINPNPYMTSILTSSGSYYNDPIQAFKSHLDQTDTLISTYQFIFGHSLRGNGLQIIIFADDQNLCIFGDTICQFLSKNYGADITFIDPCYRPNVPGKQNYTGDKAYAEQLIPKIKDSLLIMRFEAVRGQCNSPEQTNNLRIFLGSFNVMQLIYLYNLLFPGIPLPADNYTSERMIQIIINLATKDMPSNPYPNLQLTEDYMDMLREYESACD